MTSHIDKLESTEAVLAEAKRNLQLGDIAKAVSGLQSILAEKPSHKEALYYLAVSYRQKGDSAAALDWLQTLLDAYPDYGRAYQERAYNSVALKMNERALSAFEHAVMLNPALIASWRALLGRYKQLGMSERQTEAENHIQWLEAMPAELQTVTSLLYEGKLYVAEQICRQFLQKEPHQQEAMRLLAEIGTQLQIFDDAEYLLESCVEFYPEFDRARLDYVQVLHKRQKFDKALNQALRLRARAPDNIIYDVTLAAQQQAVGDFSGALSVYDKVLDRHGEMARILTSRGHALKTSGRSEDAVASYQRAYRAQPDYGDAYWSLANLKIYQFSDAELDQMIEQEALASVSTENKFHLCFALGKAFEDRGDYAESFGYYERGNSLKRSESGYRSEIVEADLESQRKLFDKDFFDVRGGYGCPSEEPIFILGLPRAGSTLLEQILASHSLVDGTMELANIIGTANRLNGQKRRSGMAPYPAVLSKLTADQAKQLGEQFLQETEHHRGDGIYFIDKMPNNFRHIPLIQLILPNAKIIDARRHPMACCFSGFKQLFAEGQEFTYGLEEIGRYYKAYVDIMAHWDYVMPGRILRVQHEDVIDDLEGQVTRVLNHCGLSFEQACVDFHKTERAIRTPSAEQVRQPIYKSGMEQWQYFADYLGPLETALGPALKNYR